MLIFIVPLAALIATIGQPERVEPAAAGSTDGQQPQSTALPSGSGDEFRQRMLEWTRHQPSALLRIRNRPESSKPAHIVRLKISSPFGWRNDPIDGADRPHEGVDLPGKVGSPVTATGTGIVRIAGWVHGYGNLVEIDHANGVQTRYGHLEKLHVVVGEPVSQGQLIGDLGSTGHSTGPHLHYEVRVKGVPMDPLRFIGQAAPAYEMTEVTAWRPEAHVTPNWIGWSDLNAAGHLPEARIR